MTKKKGEGDFVMKDRDKSTSADAKMKTRKRTKRTAKDFGTAERKRVEEQIQALSRFPSENPSPVMRISKDGTVLYCNEAGSFILNQWKCQVGQLAPSNWRQLVADVSISGVKKEFEEEYETRTFSFMLAPIAEVEYVNVYGRDITERKKAEEALRVSEERFRFALANSPIVVATLDRDLRYTWIYNPMGGFRSEDLLGKKIGLSTEPETSEMILKSLDKVLTNGESVRWEVKSKTDTGDLFFESHAEPLRNAEGEITGAALISINITERKKAEEALQKAHGELEVRVEERTRELREAGEKLQAEIVERKQAEQAVTAERKRFTDVLEQLPAYLVLLTPDYHVAYANRFFREHFGEDHGRRCFEYLFRRGEPCENCETYKTLDNMAPREWEWTGPDGHNYYIYDAPFTEPDGSTRILEVGIDITERKRAEERLRDVSSYSRSLIEASLDPLVTISAEGKITDVNKATEEVTGFGREQLIGSDFSNYFTDPEEARKGYRRVFKEGFVIDYPLAIRHKSGKIRDVLYNASVYRNEAGEIQGVFAAARDITERKKAEQKIREASLYARSLIEASLDPLVTINAEGKITDVNKATEEVTGFSREQLIGSDFSEYFTEPDNARAGYRKVFTDGFVTDYPLVIRHKSGKITDVLYNATVYKNEAGQIQGVFAAARDVTERKKAEEALRKAHDELETRVQERTRELAEASEGLRQSERDLNRAQAVARTGSWRLDVQRNELLWSDETYHIFGIPKGTQMTYEAFLNVVHPDDREYVDQKWKAALQGGPYDIEHRIIVNGEVKWVREKAELELDTNINGLRGGFGTVQDITERKKAEQALYQAKQEWERTFDSVPDLIAIVDDQHRIVRVNKAMAQQLGKTPEQCTGLFCYECVHGLSQPIENCPHTKTLQDGQQHIQELHEDRLGGDFLVSTTPLRDEKGQMIGSVHVARNITERKKMEAKLEQYARHLEDLVEEKTKQLKDSERLAAIGQTAAMVGHDIRNPLQSVEGATYLVKEELKSLPAESRQRKELEEIISLIEKQTNYIDHIVSDLQDFSRTPMPQPREVDAQDLIVESLATIDIPGNIEVQTTLQKDLPPLTADPTYIKRVLLNLIENAVQAMPNGGKLTVRAFCDDESTYICVEDTGVGISDENKPKIFLPLFTTRAKGQGFGLSVCKKLVEAHAGTITFESEVGRGTRFTVKLPLRKKTSNG